MHAHKPHKVRVRSGKAADAHERCAHGGAQRVGEREHFGSCAAFEHTAAAEQKDLVGRANHLRELKNFLVAADGAFAGALVALRKLFGGSWLVVRRLRRHVFGNVHEHRPGTAFPCDGKGFTQGIRKVGNVLYDIVIFGNRGRNAGDVRFLKAVLADEADADVARDKHNGHRVEIRRGDAGYKVGGSGAGRCNAYAGFARCARVTVRGVRRALLVRGQVMVNAMAVFIEFVVNIQHRAARIPKHGIDGLLGQTFDQDLRSCQFHKTGLLFLSSNLRCASSLRGGLSVCRAGGGLLRYGVAD
ncbi:hypothetical protein SDC9_92242 [bioreactor metagenome]|uniref:Uncharacterized protein n=1 Tax=bioreactor metagenome TaxID=1076179 RepID=A0A645A723_9ZZZZ